MLWGFFIGPALTVPLVMLPWVLKDRWMRLAALTCGVLMVGLRVETRMWPHYAAPVTALLYALLLQAMRHLRLWRWHGRPTGRSIVWAMLTLCVALAPQTGGEPQAWSLNRANVLQWLEEGGDRHLVIVRYRPRHNLNTEWVYNAADIDGAKVVWAREMDPAQNRRLLEYFKDRRVWLLEADAEPPALTPYPVGSGP